MAKPSFSVIGSDVVITGDVRAASDLHIDGVVEGDISCATLVQGPESRIKGQIEAGSARLAGQVEGEINAGELVIEAGARVTGDISYETISVASGSHVEGRFMHRRGAGAQGGAELKLVSDGSQATA